MVNKVIGQCTLCAKRVYTTTGRLVNDGKGLAAVHKICEKKKAIVDTIVEKMRDKEVDF